MAAARVHQATPPDVDEFSKSISVPMAREGEIERWKSQETDKREQGCSLFSSSLFFSSLLLSFLLFNSLLFFSSIILFSSLFSSLHFTSLLFFLLSSSSFLFSFLFCSLQFSFCLLSSLLFSSVLFSSHLFLFPLVPNLQLLSDISLPDKGAIQWLRRTAPNSWGSKGNILQYKKP